MLCASAQILFSVVVSLSCAVPQCAALSSLLRCDVRCAIKLIGYERFQTVGALHIEPETAKEQNVVSDRNVRCCSSCIGKESWLNTGIYDEYTGMYGRI